MGVVDDAQRAQQRPSQMMRDIERRLKHLLAQKFGFQRMCRRLVCGNENRRARLRPDSESYLQRKGERREALTMIVCAKTSTVRIWLFA